MNRFLIVAAALALAACAPTQTTEAPQTDSGPKIVGRVLQVEH